MSEIQTKTKPMTCIICPMGCSMEVTTETTSSGELSVVKVTDNGCTRGPQYAEKELTNPTRTLTTTIAIANGTKPLVTVKTEGEIPKDMLLQAMEIIRREKKAAPVKRGDILIYDILGTGINIVACGDVEKA